MGDKVRIVLVDDHRLFRDGVRAILGAYPDLELVGEAADAREAEQLLDDVPHDLLIVDVTLPGSNGVALMRNRKRKKDKRPILVLTMHHSADIVADAFAAGATGYALKQQSEAELVDAVRCAASGRRYLAPQIPPEVLDGRAAAGNSVLSLLSSREREIFDLIVRGSTNADVAKQLFISIKTVETHRTRILRKLGVHSLGELIRLAVRHGLLPA
jgi:DNA-binding NarL/FixJ family response regulator